VRTRLAIALSLVLALVGGVAVSAQAGNPGANVTGTKTVVGNFVEGGSVTYTIILTNAAPGVQGNAAGDEFVDVLPSELTLVSAVATSGTAVANIGTNTVTWNGNIAPGGSLTITVTATIDLGTAGSTISNQGTIHYDSDGNATNDDDHLTDDPGVGGAADPTSFQVAGSALLSASKTVDGDFSEDGTVTYEIIVHNAGTSAQGDNPGDELTDVLPDELTLLDAVTTSGTATPDLGTNTVHWNGAIPAAGSVTITITARINPGTTGLTVSNQGTINYDTDEDDVNDTSQLTDDPDVNGTQDPTEFEVEPAIEEPPLTPGPDVGPDDVVPPIGGTPTFTG
jgi:uncharacterized repeat protein (TIGR01451 family)